MLWERYRAAAISAIPMGISVGAVLGIAVYLTGNSDYREQGGWGAFAYIFAVGAGIGALSALAALIGGWLVILAAERRQREPVRTRSIRGAAGAAAGAGMLWLAVGVVTLFSTPSGAAWMFGFVMLAGIAAAGAATVAWVVLKRAERAECASHRHDT